MINGSFMKKIFSLRQYSTAVTNHARIIFISAGLLTLLGGYLTFQLPIETDIAALLPDHYISVRTLKRLNDEIGGFTSLQILLEGNNFEELKAYAELLAPHLRNHPDVKTIDYKKNVDFYRKYALLYIPLNDLKTLYQRVQSFIEEQKLAHNPLYVELDDEEDETDGEPSFSFEDFEKKYTPTDDKIYYVNPDHTILVINVYPVGKKSDVAFARKFYRSIQEIVNQHPPPQGFQPITVEYGGNFKNKIDEYLVIIDDVRKSVVSGIILIAGLLFLYFRRLSSLALIAIPLIMSLMWTFGLTRLVIGRLNTMTVFLFAILFGLGIDYGIHLYSRFQEHVSGGMPVTESLKIAIQSTGRALITSTLTTSAAFYTLMLADFRGFNEFGFIAGSSILLSLFATLTVLPAFILLSTRWKSVNVAPASPIFRLSSSFNFPPALLRIALVAIVGLTVITMFRVPDVELEYDFTNLRSNIPASIKVKQKLGTIFKESNSPAVVLVENPEELEAIREVIEEKIKNDPTPTIDKFRSIDTMIPDHQDEKMRWIKKLRTLIEKNDFSDLSADDRQRLDLLIEMTDVKPLKPEDLPEEIKRLFTDRRGRLGRFAYIFPSVQLRDGRNAIAFAEDVKTIRTKDGRVYHAANSAVISADMLLLMLKEGERAALITFVTVALLVFLHFRNPFGAFFALSPLLISLIWLVGLMPILGMKFNFYNLVVIPSIIGMGIDSGVHMVHRYLEEGPGSTFRVFRTTGMVVVICTLTTMVGFSGLIMAHHPGLNSIGVLAVLGLSFTILASVIALPLILRFLEVHFPRFLYRRMTNENHHETGYP